MNPSNAPRIAVALGLSGLLILLMVAAGAGGIAAAAAGSAGIAATLIMSVGLPEPGPQTIIARPPLESETDIEARVIEAIGEPVLLAIDGRVKIANAAAQALLGTHILGEAVRLAIRHPAAAERLSAGASDGSVELIGLGGRDQRIEMRVVTIAPGHRIIHLIDQTTRYAAERARIDFVANASHELRTPLSAILGFIETLDDEKAGGDNEVRARILGGMIQEARRKQREIADLISLSRIEAEKYQLPDETIALSKLIEEVAGELRNSAGDKKANLVLDLDRDIADVAADRAQMSQVIHNLVSNAFKYGRADAPVKIQLKPDGSLIRLSVVDHGEGIAPEHLHRLTERFYRVDSGRSRSLGGTGLGLAIVKHIIERHRGRLDITSKLGVGTTVSVLLPAAIKHTVTETTSN